MVNAQEYLNKTYPIKKSKDSWFFEPREIVTCLDIENKNLEGHLDLRDFVNLEMIICSDNEISSLDISKNEKLTRFYCNCNQLTDLDFLTKIPYPEKLECFSILNNKINYLNLKFFRPFVNMGALSIGNIDIERNQKGIYNHIYGSLESLKHMNQLKILCIAGTDIDEGLEYIPESLAENTEGEYGNPFIFDCHTYRPDARVSKIEEQLRPFRYDIKAWQLAQPFYHQKVKLEREIQELAQTQTECQQLKTKLVNYQEFSQRVIQQLKEENQQLQDELVSEKLLTYNNN